MQKVLSAAEMREVDRLMTEKYGISSLILMENAAHAAARIIAEKFNGSMTGKSVLILCGKGNNGGDGAALARILRTLGANVTVLLFGKIEETKGDARSNFEIIAKLAGADYALELLECEKDGFQTIFHKTFFRGDFRPYEVIVDAIFGTGLTRPLDESFAYVAEILSDKQKWKQRKKEFLLVSLDIPSGLSADSAEPIGSSVHADLTVTFTAPKLANVMSPAAHFNGELRVAEIGSDSLLEALSPQVYVAIEDGIRGLLCQTQVSAASYKKTRGTCLIIAGSENYSGAAALAANACFASGAGMVSVAVPEKVKAIVAAKVFDEIIVKSLEDTRVSEEKVDVVALGCGLSSDAKTKKLVREAVEKRTTPVVLDAEALNALSPFDLQGADDLPLILTPHIGEFERLSGKREIKDRITSAREFAEKHNVILVLKGERSLIAAPDGTIYINPTGNAGVSRAGAGDTLTGLITGFLAQTFAVKNGDADDEETNSDKALRAVIAALYIAGRAGDIAAEKFGQRFMTATDVRDCLSEAIFEIDDREKISI